MSLDAAAGKPPFTNGDWQSLVTDRRGPLGRFLSWAAEREGTDSMRLANRHDIGRVRTVADAFLEPWWATVVYSCFDSVIGALAVSELFHEPISADEATRQLSNLVLRTGAVGGHRTQPAHKGAKVALVSACNQAEAFEAILNGVAGFHDRYLALRGLHAKQWGRTTCYDLLVRAGQLKIGSGVAYEPDRAYLAESTGPGKGFQLIWGIEATRSNADACEAILRTWSSKWDLVAKHVGVAWTGAPYGPGDFENALCIYQERGNPGHPSATNDGLARTGATGTRGQVARRNC